VFLFKLEVRVRVRVRVRVGVRVGVRVKDSLKALIHVIDCLKHLRIVIITIPNPLPHIIKHMMPHCVALVLPRGLALPSSNQG